MSTAELALIAGRTGPLVPTFVTRIRPRTVMVHARDLARIGVRRFGGTYRQYLAEALRMAWAEMRRRRADLVAMERRVLGCVEGVLDHPGAHGLTNIATADHARSRTTALYEDAFHFGRHGQAIIARVIRPRLGGGRTRVARR